MFLYINTLFFASLQKASFGKTTKQTCPQLQLMWISSGDVPGNKLGWMSHVYIYLDWFYPWVDQPLDIQTPVREGTWNIPTKHRTSGGVWTLMGCWMSTSMVMKQPMDPHASFRSRILWIVSGRPWRKHVVESSIDGYRRFGRCPWNSKVYVIKKCRHWRVFCKYIYRFFLLCKS